MCLELFSSFHLFVFLQGHFQQKIKALKDQKLRMYQQDVIMMAIILLLKAAAKRGLRRPAAAAAAPAAVPVVADFDHKGCSKCKYKGHGCARCKDFADQQTKGFFWLNGEVVRKVPA